jgi:putative transposase
MKKKRKLMGVQQTLLHPDTETKSILEYLCKQSGKLYNTGIYFARQTLFKTGKLLTRKFALIYEQTISKSTLFSSIPAVVAQQTLISVTESFKSFKELKAKYLQVHLTLNHDYPII